MKYKVNTAFFLALMLILFARTSITQAQSSLSDYVVFPQVVIGQLGEDFYVTQMLISNPNGSSVTVEIGAYRQTGVPWNLFWEVRGGQELPNGDVVIPPHTTVMLDTSANRGAFEIGWVPLQATRPITANAIIQIFTAAGVLRSSVGVPATMGISQFAFPVVRSSAQSLDTGIVLNNDGPFTITVTLTLYDENGSVFASRPLTLLPGSQQAQFLTQLFTGVPPDFRGSIEANASSFIMALALFVQGAELTSLQVVDLTSII